ncbi:hypothetical protein HJC23_002321 [Cyclotella cryptica]|uniref:Signal recognition particle subunit SRP68 n=1 Tax=Cyclotella cryptica TaxID=29204 RepID=A0ABD3QLQ8_9STRA|eukprot:CCRYP_004411-RA/>CCRYP_004411-RA protein AED:0.00 eAED:0.00 QI:21/-1/1/1/-1/1/1/87/670
MTSAPPPSAPPPLRIYLHSTLHRSHPTNTQTDHTAYASYCTRRLHRLRHHTTVKRDLLHLRLYKSSAGTKPLPDGHVEKSKSKHAYRAIDMSRFPSEVLASHENYFLEPLYCAERAWAQAMAIKDVERGGRLGEEEATTAGGGEKKKKKSSSRLRSDRLKRMKKAVAYAEILEGLTVCTKSVVVVEGKEEDGGEENAADMPVDEYTRMEAKAYASWMRGNLAMEREDWKTACEEYQTAFTLCETIAKSGIGSDGDDAVGTDVDKVAQLELLDFFTTRANNVIAPLLRYCMYELQERGVSTNESILNTNLQTSMLEASGSNTSNIVFRDNSIVVESKELKMALLKVQDAKKEWEDDKNNNNNNNNNASNNAEDSKFMDLLSGYDDVISLATQESKQLVTLKSGPAVNAKKFQLVNIVGYCKYQKLKLVMERNEDMVNGILKRHGGGSKNRKKELTLKHLEEVTHLYDALLQDAQAIASLPGGGSVDDFVDGSSSVEDEFLLEAKANILRLRSLRCYYLARMHASPLVGKYSHAVALLDQAESLAREALEEIGACDLMERRDEILERLSNVVEEMKGEKCRVFAMAYLSANYSSNTSLPLLQRLHDYDIPATPTYIADVPPKLEPIACKPSFFDVALNYVADYPMEDLERVLEMQGEKATGSSGLLGWFRRG